MLVILFFLNKSETKLLENSAEVSEILEIERNTIENLRLLKENIYRYMQFIPNPNPWRVISS